MLKAAQLLANRPLSVRLRRLLNWRMRLDDASVASAPDWAVVRKPLSLIYGRCQVRRLSTVAKLLAAAGIKELTSTSYFVELLDIHTRTWRTCRLAFRAAAAGSIKERLSRAFQLETRALAKWWRGWDSNPRTPKGRDHPSRFRERIWAVRIRS